MEVPPAEALPQLEGYVPFTLTERTSLYLQYIDWGKGAEGNFHGYSRVRLFVSFKNGIRSLTLRLVQVGSC